MKYFIKLTDGRIITGNTYTFLARVASELVKDGIEIELLEIKPIEEFWNIDC